MTARLAILAALVATGCASAPPLTQAGAMVRTISSEAAARGCRFIRVVEFTDRVTAMGKSPPLMRAIGENGLRNAVAAAGANAVVVQRSDSDWFVGNVAYQGEAFICP